MRLQRLDPKTDEAIYFTLYQWDQDTPPWFRASEDVWGTDSWEEFYARTDRDDVIDCAVYDDADTLQGSITVIHKGGKVFEVFIIGRRSSDAQTLTLGCFLMAKQLMDAGIADAFTSWVCDRNRGALRLNKEAGMIETGVQLIKGVYKGRPLYWKQMFMDKGRVNGLWQNDEKETSPKYTE